MQMVILAAGLATRLRPLTNTQPKSMIAEHGKPFLAYQLELVKKNNLHDVVVCVGHLKKQIMDYFKDGKKFGVNIVYSQEDTPSGTGTTLQRAAPLLGESFFMMYGDSYLEGADFSAIARFFFGHNKLGLNTYQKHPNSAYVNNMRVAKNLIVEYKKTAQGTGMTHIDYGLHIYHKSALRFLPVGEGVDLTILQERLAHDGQLLGYEVKEPFIETGSFDGLEQFKKHMRSKHRTSIVEKSKKS